MTDEIIDVESKRDMSIYSEDNILSPKRLPNETFETYKERRAELKIFLDSHSRGEFIHKSKHLQYEGKGDTYVKRV